MSPKEFWLTENFGWIKTVLVKEKEKKRRTERTSTEKKVFRLMLIKLCLLKSEHVLSVCCRTVILRPLYQTTSKIDKIFTSTCSERRQTGNSWELLVRRL